MALSLEQLIAIAGDYWPSAKDHDFRQEIGPEMKRLYERWEQELKKIDRWWAFLEELETELPGFKMGDATATPDACFRCVAYPAQEHPLPTLRWVVVGCVSILAPVYTVYGVHMEYGETARASRAMEFDPLRPETRAPADIIARRIEATFGADMLPREIARTPVPLYVQWKEPPETILFHALFTSQPESLP
ncbi:MAG TPA: hypothetical protein VEY88_13190 [Archangium sp.]|nr:hypothetical protein [Archangium sp.]